jgi:hypothetical protein
MPMLKRVSGASQGSGVWKLMDLSRSFWCFLVGVDRVRSARFAKWMELSEGLMEGRFVSSDADADADADSVVIYFYWS